MSKVKAEYDFEAQPGTGEMSISAGEILTVIKENVTGGWIEGRNAKGSIGLFPESYVVPYVTPEISQPTYLPPPPPPSRPTDDWGQSTFGAPAVASSFSSAASEHSTAVTSSSLPHHTPLGAVSSTVNDDFDDEWTDDDDENVESMNSGSHHENRSVVSRSQSAGGDKQSKVNRNINRFSNFVKSGMESYILGEAKIISLPGEKHEIIANGNLIQWRPIQQFYTCSIDKPKKETKLKGLKSFIAYSLTSSLSRIQVSRRYKHFDWLHEQLSAKYIMIPIPPLPEKQVSGRYEEDLIDHRKHILQLWVNKICRHPVLSQSEVWLHFISCTDEKEWKNGKRKSEKDEYVGGNFLQCVSVPSSPLDTADVERRVNRFQTSIKMTEDAMRVMQERMAMFQKLYIGPVKSNWQKLALAFSTLGQSFNTDDHTGSSKMVDALKHTAHHYHSIGDEFEQHTKQDIEPVIENLYSFKGTVQVVPDILSVHKQAVQKMRENDGKLSHADAERMRQRVDSTSYSLLAEINHLNSEKVEDLRLTMGTYLKRQAEFYQKIANNLRELSTHYDF